MKSTLGKQRFAVMGAGAVGFHLARELSLAGHSVVVIEIDPNKRAILEDHLDIAVVIGNGAHVSVLEQANVENCDLFMAVSSADEANLAASVLAKRMGARRSVVRVGVTEDVTRHRRLYEDLFSADLLLSTQLLSTTNVLNYVLGHNTLAVEYLAGGKVQLRKVHIDSTSILTRKPLSEIEIPKGSLVVAFYRDGELIIPSGQDGARDGDDALILCTPDTTERVARLLNQSATNAGTAVIAGGGETAVAVAEALINHVDRIKLIERDRQRAEVLSSRWPEFEILHGNATDIALLRAERVAEARSFIALTGDDETNLMACLLAQDLEVDNVVAVVERHETSHLWRRLGLMRIVSPRRIAADRVKSYIDHNYSDSIVSLEGGDAEVLERTLAAASPATGCTLAEISPPRGIIVGAVVRGDKVFVPRGEDRLEVGDNVILFVARQHLSTVRLLFPGRESSVRI